MQTEINDVDELKQGLVDVKGWFGLKRQRQLNDEPCKRKCESVCPTKETFSAFSKIRFLNNNCAQKFNCYFSLLTLKQIRVIVHRKTSSYIGISYFTWLSSDIYLSSS